jgi:hypothetical protein
LLGPSRRQRYGAGARRQQAADPYVGFEAAANLDIGSEYVGDGGTILRFGQAPEFGCLLLLPHLQIGWSISLPGACRQQNSADRS